MGKPFKTELKQIPNTYNWAQEQDIRALSDWFQRHKNIPIYFVGSGGSLSACYYAVSLAHEIGITATAVTPLELYHSRKALSSSAVFFISAGGHNKDILFGFNSAIQTEPRGIASLCMKLNSKLEHLSRRYSITDIFEFSIPVGKDGFLATNSLVAFFTILNKALSKLDSEIKSQLKITEGSGEEFLRSISEGSVITVLHGGWSKCVAVDIESKCTEGALSATLIADYRNFAHGRHHWFAKQNTRSAVIALISPEDESIASKTLSLIPEDIPRLSIRSTHDYPNSSIDLLIQSFRFIDLLGQKMKIDPGKPEVPEFGRKLYHLNYQTDYTTPKFKGVSTRAMFAIRRKTKVGSLEDISQEDLKWWLRAYSKFINRLNNRKYGAIVLDYDGTLCPASSRYEGISDNTAVALNRLLKDGAIIGIATGRGKSVRRDLQKSISPECWKSIFIGYYNGSQIGSLAEDLLPNIKLDTNSNLLKVKNYLETLEMNFLYSCDLRPSQLSIETSSTTSKRMLVDLIRGLNISGINVLESSHSIDIIPSDVSKQLVVDYCKLKAKNVNLPEDILCIGDKGQWPGNDYVLLSNPYSLSVDEVSMITDSCWNIAGMGIKNVDATNEYLDWISIVGGSLKIKITK